MTDRKEDFAKKSTALEANLRETASDVQIPEEYVPLVEAAKPHYGLHQDLSDLLKEYFHPFRNDREVLVNIARQVLGRWFNYQTSENRLQLFRLFSKLLWEFIPQLADKKEQFQECLRVTFAFWGESLGSRYGEEYAPTVAEYLRKLPTEQIPIERLVGRDNQLAALRNRFDRFEQTREPYLELYRSLLDKCLERAAESLDIPSWARDNPGVVEDYDEVTRVFSELRAEKIEQHRKKLAKGNLTPQKLSKVPNLSNLVSHTLRRLPDISSPLDRFQVSLFILKDDVTGQRQKEVVSLLLDVLGNLLRTGNEELLERIIYQLTALLKKRSDFSPDVRFTIYERIGISIGRNGSEKLATVLTDNLLSWPFEEPDISGATMDWKVKVNPFHLRNVRCLINIITSNPELYQRLIAALTVFTRIGGVYVPDTALFQKDISKLLAAEIEPVYHHVRQLCASFPVFFNELGAEGELRQHSTFLDQEFKRKNSVIHFLRKAVHAETNNLMVDFSLEVLRYWHSGNAERLVEFLPPELSSAPERERQFREGPAKVLEKLVGKDDPAFLAKLSENELRERIDAQIAAGEDKRSCELVFALVRMIQLLQLKYTVDAEHFPVSMLERFNVPQHLVEAFQDVFDLGKEYPLLDSILDLLEHLKAIIIEPGEIKANENIYYKRHVAAGIPSMYGEYSEPRFDALGLSYRLERLALRIFVNIGESIETRYVSKEFLWRVVRLLRKYQRALDIDGLLKDSFRIATDLLEKCLESYRINYYQFRNILRHFLAAAVKGVVEGSILGEFAEAASRIHRNKLLSNVPSSSHGATKMMEMSIRELLATTFGLQELDAFVGNIIDVADKLAMVLDSDKLSKILNFRGQRLITFLHDPVDILSDPMHLGSKGFSLKRLANYAFNIPHGFIISTELFSIRDAVYTYPPLYDDIRRRVFAALDRLENDTGRKLGDPSNLLMLSVRSSGASSMPGMMTTFINVGINEKIVSELSRKHNYGWTSWDCYRRFLQTWGMSEGIPRDEFDRIIMDFKKKYRVRFKLEFTADAMREIAFAYRERLAADDIKIPDDPREQVLITMKKVLESWDNEQARLYRKQMDIAEEWGTSVIVQQMVLGNINYDSGTGVVFTHPPNSRSLSVKLHGDFVFCSQGEDLVAGLVFPMPISEYQRREHKIYHGATGSLETQLPGIYNALLEVSRELVTHRGFEHQEIEFTFESSAADDLHILQSRAMVFDDEKSTAVFVDTSDVWDNWLATGLGSSGGAFSGRIVLTEEDIGKIRAEHPEDELLLVRPDTVPEDIQLIVNATGLLTARGGGTSHAAITAKKLGKTCIVNCRSMEVDDSKGIVRFGDEVFTAGDWLSIDGNTGNIFKGKFPITSGNGKM